MQTQRRVLVAAPLASFLVGLDALGIRQKLVAK